MESDDDRHRVAALPTVQLRRDRDRGQLQMEQSFLRVQRSLFGKSQRQTIAHYELLRPVGQGAMGIVYEALDQRLDRTVALKLVRPELLESALGEPRLLSEARVLAQIAHPNVVAIHDVGEMRGVVYIAMEFVRGETVRQWLQAAPRPLGEILDVFLQAAAGLSAAHRAGIIHRDFKPDNVLIGEDGRARVVDFGLAFARLDEIRAAHLGDTPAPWGASSQSSSVEHAIAGTIGYMSPEQLQGRPLDVRSDLFSFCVALHEAVLGELPFAGEGLEMFIENVVHGVRVPIDSVVEIPSWLRAILDRGLATSREERFHSMAALSAMIGGGRPMLSSLGVPVPTSVRQRIVTELGRIEWQMVSTHLASLVCATDANASTRVLACAHDARAPHVRDAFTSFVLRMSTDEVLPLQRPSSTFDDESWLALVFERAASMVSLAGIVRSTTARDVPLALDVARSLAHVVFALGQIRYTVGPEAIGSLLVDVETYEIGPIDPTCLRPDNDSAERYRVVGTVLQALVATDVANGYPSISGLHDARQIPAAITAVIDRLTDPTTGYASVRGVIHDLDRCAELHRQRRWAETFPLATRDVDGRFQISDRLQGRERELERLGTLADEVGPRASGLVLVTGSSGIGKTALLDEIGRRFGESRVAHGKFDQYANHEPYTTVTQALRGLVRRFLDASEPSREEWRARIVEAVAPNATLMFAMVPELRALLGEQPETVTAPPKESAVRFGETLKRLLVACAARLSPLWIVLDDMQWCDLASGRLVTSMLADDDIGNMIWVCAYRDNEVGVKHAIRDLVEHAASRTERVQHLRLRPLTSDELGEFLVDTLGCDSGRVTSLAAFFRDKTDGNPLFARALLASLHDQGLLSFSPRGECWSWSDDAIRSATLPDDIQEVVGHKFGALSTNARQLLAMASCVGRDVERVIVVDILGRHGVARADVERCIDECVDRGMLATSVNASCQSALGEVLNFTHDRIQQTAYAFVDADEHDRWRLETGLALLDRGSTDDVAERLFRIVGYLNAGARYATEQVRTRIVELDLLAAQRALVASAFDDAVRLLEQALGLLPNDHWSSRYDQSIELHLKYMHALALLGRRADQERVFDLLCTQARTNGHIARIYELEVMLESSRGDHRSAISRGLAGLRLLGEHLAEAPRQLDAAGELIRTWHALLGIDLDRIERGPVASEEQAATSRLLVAVSAPAYLSNNNLFAIVMMRIVRRSLRHGVSESSSHGLAGFALIVSGLRGQHELARRYVLAAHRLDERFGYAWLQPRVDLMSGIFIQPWTRPFEECEQILSRGARVAIANADFVYASYNETSRVCSMFYRGEALDRVLEAGPVALRYTQRASDSDMEAVVTSVLQVCRCLRGETRDLDDFSTPDESGASFMARLDEQTTPIGVFFCRAIRCSALYVHGCWEQAAELGLAASVFEDKAFSNPSQAEHLFYYAMATLRIWTDLGWTDRLRARRVVARAVDRFARWAKHCPANFRSRLELLRAERARIHDPANVLNHLHAALENATLDRRIQYEAIAAELAAEHGDALGQRSVARIYRARAIVAYRRWGATVKAQQLALLPHELSPPERTG